MTVLDRRLPGISVRGWIEWKGVLGRVNGLRRSSRAAVVAGLLLGALAAIPCLGAKDAPPAITFFVAGDSHFGAQGVDETNRSIVAQMNALAGTPYPDTLGGRVDTPRGVLFMGDMTDASLPEQWTEFERVYGRDGKDGILKSPVFEAIGNHDIIGDSPIVGIVKRRHGSLIYSWNWNDLHFVCLDLHPDANNLRWLAKDLAKVGPERPLIIFFHYSLAGPYSDFWEEAQKEAFAQAIEGKNVLAIFHGHYHRAGRYQWHGQDVFLPGSPRHSSHAFLVVRVGAGSLAVGFWDFDSRRWSDAFSKPIRR
jgi:hypothetical protein